MCDPYLLYLKRRTRERYTHFVLAYAERVGRLVRRMVPSADVADDIIQETFLCLGVTKKQAEQIKNPRAYILGTALHRIQHRSRDASVRARHEEEASRLRSRLHPAAADEVIAKENFLRLHKALDSLPAPLRLAMHLRCVEGLSYREISAVTGLSVNAVSVQIYRGRKKLKSLLGESQLTLALLKLKELGPDAWFLEPSRRKLPALREVQSRQRLESTSPPAQWGLLLTLGLACLCVAIPGVFLLRGASGFSARALAQRPTSFERETGSLRQTWIRNARESLGKRVRGSGGGPFLSGPHLGPRADETSSKESVFLRYSKGDPDMKLQASSLVPAFLTLTMSATSHGAEAGDFDGDGRLSIKDVVHLQMDLPPKPGSYEFMDSWCHTTTFTKPRHSATFVYLESLRRNVPGSYPFWFPLDPTWTQPISQLPLPQNPSVQVTFDPMDAAGGTSDVALVRFVLKTSSPIRAFSLALESDEEVLQVPFLVHVQCPAPSGVWDDFSWYDSYNMCHCHKHNLEGVGVFVMPPASLITGGKYVITRGVPRDDELTDVIPPGEYPIVTQARLPQGTHAGKYKVRLLPGSEALLEDGTLVSPAVQGEGEIAVKASVTGGFPGGRVPPLRFDMTNRMIQGKVEFQLVDPTTGRVGTIDDPIGEGHPADPVSFVVQMRTEVPLNEVYFEVNWPPYALSCEGMESIYANPEDDEVPPGMSNLYVPYRGSGFPLPQCTGIGDGRHLAFYRMGGAWSWPERAEASYPDRVFEYFRPIGDWADLTRVTLRIPDDAVGGTDIPLTFKPFHRREPGELESPYPVNFAPYYADWPCHPDRKPADFPWTYDVHYTNTVVRVLGKDEPPPPPDYGIRIALGEAEGKPGDTVEVPIMASTEVPLYTLRLAFESDPTALRVDAVEVNDVISPVKGPRTEEVARGQMDGFLDCTEDQDGDGYPDACFEAAPFAVQFYKSEERFTVIDVSAHLDNWITLEPREVARLKVRIQENAPGTQTDLLPAKVPLEIFHQPVIYESGGFKSPLNESNRFGPATEIHGSHVLYPEAALKPFVRGDGNVDGRVDLSDAISTLNYLFLGAAVPGCVRAADVNDDGTLGLSDAVYLLVSLFQGGRLIPPPYPNCGPDTTADSLNCVETTCRRV